MLCICVISGFLRTGLLWQPGPPPKGSYVWTFHRQFNDLVFSVPPFIGFYPSYNNSTGHF
ncbi:hypothetical protein PR003_g31777 [Phytophthora rubi]|uniref:Uncharacterized protein n=1 Tax=Phytophthora rubi TaxID=129364 RepID=A0A6A3H6L7_9STRA|nr:hypothetical protein PR002_g30720 [Phytophthora rubi]KAE8964762.1 hypothetical protein PR001_g28945 [Phytophthora rubi]KAE9267429.1 hypothetical protein PR003_g31777 [Phytophthora rubi]